MSRGTVVSRNQRWDVDTLTWVAETGLELSGTTLTVSGAVTQGAAGASAWKVDGSAVTQPVSGPLTDAQLRATPIAVTGGATTTQYADGTARGTPTGTLAMGDDGTNVQSIKVDAAGELQVDVLTLPAMTGTVTANQGTANTVANSWPTLVTDGTDTAIVVGDSANEPSAKGLMIAGYSRDSNLAYPFPLLQQNYTVPTGNTLAVPVDLRTTAGLNGGTNPRSNMILVGGRSNSSSVFGSQLVFGNGETLIDNPANTYALQVRELGQSYSNNGSISALNQRFTVSNRYVNWSAGVITLTNSSFVGTLKPVVSTDNGTTWDFVSAINTVTGEFVSSLVDSAAAGTFVIPSAAGSTNYGVQISAYTSGSVQPRVSANNGINSIYTAGTITNIATGQGRTLLFGTITQATAGTTQLVAANATKKIKLVSYSVTLDATGTFKFTDGTVDLTGVIPMAANQNHSIAGQSSSHLLETGAINRALSITTATLSGKAFGHFSYFLEA